MQLNEPVKVTIDLEKIARNLRTPDGLSAGVESARASACSFIAVVV